jgi:hypothetical protein
MRKEHLRAIMEARARRPQAVAEAAAARRQPDSPLNEAGRTMLLAVDDPGRGSLGAGHDPAAMGDRADLLGRLCTALEHPGVTGILGTPDIVDDLLLLGVLDDKAVYGSMNQAGLAGAAWGIDDRFTAYDAPTIASMGFEGGKMRLRMDLHDPSTATMLEACGKAVCELSMRELVALVEPVMVRRTDGRVSPELTADATIQAATIAGALGVTSAFTWLGLPFVDEIERIAAATTLPVVLVGDELAEDPDATLDRWRAAVALPNVIGFVAGPSLLYPPGGDVAAAVEAAAGLLTASP